MRTDALVAYIVRKNSDWDATTILSFVNEIQRQMYAHPLNNREVFVNGKHPTITFDGSDGYEISTANGFPEDAIIIGDIYSESGSCKQSIDFQVENYTESTMPIVKPIGELSGTYYIQYFKMPKWVSIREQLEVPPHHHMTTLMEGVQAMIDEADYGTGRQFSYSRFKTVLLKEFWDEMNVRSRKITSIRKGWK